MEEFDAIVVGSGFGGSVMTYRLAKEGYRVCLLERGKAYPAGSFPRSPYQMQYNLWDPSEGLHGLFDVWSFRGLDAVVSSGLGGGSLLYANVLLRRPEEWFKEDRWPVSYEQLAPHYKDVEDMLGANSYPDEYAKQTRKTRVFLDAVQRIRARSPELEIELDAPNLAVSFYNRAGKPVQGDVFDDGDQNLHGRPRLTCQLCGECDIGCNRASSFWPPARSAPHT